MLFSARFVSAFPFRRWLPSLGALVFLMTVLALPASAQTAPPANDNFANAQDLGNGSAGSVTGTNVAATEEVDEPSHGVSGAGSVWYRWTAPVNGIATFNTFGSNFDTGLGIYTGSDINSLREIDRNNDASNGAQSSITFWITAGRTYDIAVDGNQYPDTGNNSNGNIVLNWSLIPSPPNDNFANSQVLTTNSGRVSGTNVAATEEADEPGHGVSGIGSVWYRWTALSSGTATFNTFGSNFDTGIGVYTGAGIGSLAEVAANDDSGSGTQSSVSFSATAGQTYFVAVDGNQYPGPGDVSRGNITLTWNGPPVYAISGRVVIGTTGLAGATVRRSGAGRTTSVVTNNDGTYTLPEVPSGTYNVTASKAGYGFLPPLATITVGAGSRAGINFTALQTPYISGRVVSSSGPGIAGVAITRRQGSSVATTLTNADGYYGFSHVPVGTYTVTPARVGYSFTPVSSLVTITTTSAVRISFTGYPVFAISGYVTGALGRGIAGVSVACRVSGTATTIQTVLTNSTGRFTFPAVRAGTYTITPTLRGLTFTPDRQNIIVTTSGRTGVAFSVRSVASGQVAGESAPVVSTVRLSTITVDPPMDSVQLRFAGLLDAQSAADPSHYSVSVNGRTLSVESVSYNSSSRSVTLTLPAASLRVDDNLSIQWVDISDNVGHSLSGKIGPLTVH